MHIFIVHMYIHTYVCIIYVCLSVFVCMYIQVLGVYGRTHWTAACITALVPSMLAFETGFLTGLKHAK